MGIYPVQNISASDGVARSTEVIRAAPVSSEAIADDTTVSRVLGPRSHGTVKAYRIPYE